MSSEPGAQRYGTEEAEVVLARALQLDAAAADGSGLTAAQLERIAGEVGVSAAALAVSLAEHAVAIGGEPADHAAGRLLGPRRVAAVRTYPVGPDWVRHRLERELARRGLDYDAGDGRRARWSQRRAWWPDLHRVTAHTHVTATVGEHPDGCAVRLEADLDAARHSHAFGAALSLGAVLAVPALVPPAWTLPALAAAVVGGPWLAVVTYRRRARLVEERLDALLASLGL